MRRRDSSTPSYKHYGLHVELMLVLGALLINSTGCQDRAPVEPNPPPIPSVTPGPPPPSPGTPQTPPVSTPVSARTEYVYVSDREGSEARLLALGGWPAWSPDGRRIAFHRDGKIHVIGVDGSDEVRLAAGAWPAWSPDGDEIAFVDDEGIKVMNADGTAPRTLLIRPQAADVNVESYLAKPSWSPDGARIAYEYCGDVDNDPNQIFVMNADGSNPQALTRPPAGVRYAESDPSWSPNGSKLVYWSFGFGVATVDPNTGVSNTLYADYPVIAYGARPVWSPDGSAVAFNSYAWSNGRRDVFEMKIAGRDAHVLIANGYHAVWSPDGDKITFVRAE